MNQLAPQQPGLGFSDADLHQLPHQLLGPFKMDKFQRTGSGSQHAGIGFAFAFHQHLHHLAFKPVVAGLAQLRHQFIQPVEPLLLHLLRHIIGHLSGRRSLPGRIQEGEGRVIAYFPDQ
ncbi:hypothetical protein D3C75_803470 [compost metagenome]